MLNNQFVIVLSNCQHFFYSYKSRTKHLKCIQWLEYCGKTGALYPSFLKLICAKQLAPLLDLLCFNHTGLETTSVTNVYISTSWWLLAVARANQLQIRFTVQHRIGLYTYCQPTYSQQLLANLFFFNIITLNCGKTFDTFSTLLKTLKTDT